MDIFIQKGHFRLTVTFIMLQKISISYKYIYFSFERCIHQYICGKHFLGFFMYHRCFQH